MTVRVDWDDHEHSILLYTFSSIWTWDELYDAVNKGLELAATVPHKIDSIIDFQNSRGVPPKAFSQVSRITSLPYDQSGLVIIAGGGTIFLSLFNLFSIIAGSLASKYCWVSDLDKAYKVLAERRKASTSEHSSVN